jgi:cyclopropane fatty-acyl-phospholipid synthase-like methyltransferase
VIPARVRWAVDQLDVGPSDEILEIGCGAGVAVSLVCDRLDGGSVTGIDRSATAIARANRRNAEHVASGRAVLRHMDLAALSFPGRRFDKAFAVNVNLFWVPSAVTELTLIAEHLRTRGGLFLFYETPDGGRAGQIADRVAAALRGHGFASVAVDHASPKLVCVRGQAGHG